LNILPPAVPAVRYTAPLIVHKRWLSGAAGSPDERRPLIYCGRAAGRGGGRERIFAAWSNIGNRYGPGARMNTPAVMRRRRPGQVWAAVEGTLAVIVVLIVVSVAWFNDPHSLGRLGLLIGSWGIAGYLVWRSAQARRAHA
jgi:hypothetical protein